MVSDKIYRVFVSSTYMDNRKRREQVLAAIQRAKGFQAIAMEWWSADERPPHVVDEERVGEADLFLLIIAHRYGAIAPGHVVSYTEREFDAALELGTDIIPFVIDEDAPVDRRNDFDPGPDRWKKQDKLDAFKAKVNDGKRIARPFTDGDLGMLVMQALNEWRERKESPKGTRKKAAASLPKHSAEIASYLRCIGSEHESIALAGFETKVRVPIKLDDLYVPLRAMVDLRSSGTGRFGSADEAMGDESLAGARDDVPLTQAFGCAKKYGDRRGLVILGDPGSGKTTQMKRMLLSVIRNGAGELGLDPEVIPVLLCLRNLTDTTRGFAQFVDAEHEGPHYDLPKGFGKRLLKRGKLLFLLDGLDEVKAERRGEVARWIEDAATVRKDCHFVVTCRYAGYAEAARLNEQFLELHLRPLEREQSEDFIRRWFHIVETSLAPDKKRAERVAVKAASELIDDLSSPDIRASRVFEMTRNPLLLTAICLVHRDRGKLPRRRVDLYEECVSVLLERWREAKKIDLSFDAKSARLVLQPVAWHLHQKKGRTRATAEELKPALDPALAAVRWGGGSPVDFLETIRDESGLLTGWSGESYGFMHLGFQEYLAARHLVRLMAKEPSDRDKLLGDLATKFGQSWWREVTLLMLAMDEAPAEEFFRRVVGRVAFARHSDLLNACLEDVAEFTPRPFLELLSENPGTDRRLWDRQLAAARVVLRLAPTEASRLGKKLAGHPHPELAMLFGAAGAVTSLSERGGVELVSIPGGRFLMGADPALEIDDIQDEDLRQFMMKWATPLHEVTVSPFHLGRCPVTNAEYREFLKSNGGRQEPEEWANGQFNGPDQPVVGVDWREASTFCAWVGGRLPTEAEWEYACRGQVDGVTSKRTRYWSGDREEDLARVAWYRRNSDSSTKPVGGKPANPFGLHDMHGNVWEWCADWLGNYTADAVQDPSGPATGSARVLRGGSWINHARDCRSARRDAVGPGHRDRSVGFRVARGPVG